MGFSRTSLKNLIRLPESLQGGSLANEAVNRIHTYMDIFDCTYCFTNMKLWHNKKNLDSIMTSFLGTTFN